MRFQRFQDNRLKSAKPFGFGRRTYDKIDLLEQQLSKGYRVLSGQKVRLYSPEYFTRLLNLGRIKYLSNAEKKLIAVELKRLRASVGTVTKEVRITSPKRLRRIAQGFAHA